MTFEVKWKWSRNRETWLSGKVEPIDNRLYTYCMHIWYFVFVFTISQDYSRSDIQLLNEKMSYKQKSWVFSKKLILLLFAVD